MANDFLKISEKQRKKRIPSSLKDLEYSPTNASFGRVCDEFRGRDELRPVMTYVNYDKENGHIVCTDAHKLLLLSPKPFPKFDGLYRTPKEIKKWIKEFGEPKKGALEKPIEDEKYPNYLGIIQTDNKISIKVDIQKLFYFARVLIDAKDIVEADIDKYGQYIKFDEPKIIRFVNQSTYSMILRYKSEGGMKSQDGYSYIGVNGRLLAGMLRGFFLMYDKLENPTPTFFTNHKTHSRALLFDFNNDTKVDVSTMNGGLLMPVVLDSQYGSLDFNYDKTDIGNAKDFGDLMPTMNVIYDLDENKILSNGELYDIDEQLGYKPKYIISKDKNSGKPEKNTNFVLEKRIKGLKILYRNTKNETIKKRIKGLEILLKKSIGDDLPF